VRQRLQAFVRSEVERRLKPLFTLRDLPLIGVARGLAFQLIDALGCLPTAEAGEQLRALDRASRRALGRAGVRFGAESLYVEPLLGAESARFRALLWAVRQGRAVPPLPGTRALGKALRVDPKLAVFVLRSAWPASHWRTGAASRSARAPVRCGARARAQRRAVFRRFRLGGPCRCRAGDLRQLLIGLGYRVLIRDGVEVFVARPRRLNGAARRATRRHVEHDGHPFAKLKQLKFA
jgi:hypothetical protein